MKPMDMRARSFSSAPHLRRRVLWMALALAIGLPAAQAQQVTPDGGTDTHVIDAANGVPVVNIAAPNAAGVSHNTYQQFGVGGQGLVLDNSGALSATRLAGYVAGNPNFHAGQSASLILNEVTSTLPSRLNGAMEVAGPKAQVVVANPNGISCDGCGFINVSRGVLTTGTPVFGSDGSLSGLRVTGGTITIEGAGLNGQAADRIDLLARAVAINAGLWADRLDMVTGPNRIDYATLAAQPIAGTGAKPAFALDVAALGGMYAGAIRLVGTEAGLGVNSQGQIAAQDGDLTVIHAGHVVLTGKTTATGSLTLDVAQALTNQGTLAAGRAVTLGSTDFSNRGVLYSGGAMNVDAAGSVDNSGQVEAQGGPLTVQSGAFTNAAGGSVYAGGSVMLSAASFDNAGTFESAQGIVLQSKGDADNTGNFSADAGNINLVAATIESTGSFAASGNAALHANAGLTTGGTLVAGGAVTLAAPSLATAGTVQAGTTLGFDGGTLTNSGKLYALGGSWTATLSGAFANQGSGDIYGSQGLALSAASLANAGGIEAQQGDAITLGGTLSNSGTLQSDRGGVALDAASLTNTGTLSAGQDLQWQVGNAAQNGGVLVSGQTMNLSSGSFDNQADGQIQSGTDLALSAATLDNEGTIDANGNAVLTGATLSNASTGQLLAAGTLTVGETGSVGNAGVLQAGDDLTLTQAASLTNAAHAMVYAGQDFNLALSQALNNAGTLYAARTATLSMGSVDNAGTLRSDGNLSLTSAGDVVSSGAIQAQQSVSLQSGADVTNSGELYAIAGGLTVRTKGAFSATSSGDIYSRQDMGLQVGSFANAGTLEAGQSVDVVAQGAVNNSGTVQADDGNVAVSANGLANQGAISATGNLQLAASGTLGNAGQVVTGGTLEASGTAIANSGQMESAGNATLQAGTIDNSGRLQSDAALTVRHNTTLTNEATGLLLAAGDLSADTASLLSNAGVVQSGGHLSIEGTGTLDTAAGSTLYGAALTTLQLGGGFSNAGKVYGGQGVQLTAARVDNAGTLRSGAALGVTTQGAASNGGTAYAAGPVIWSVAGTLTNTGVLASATDATLTAASVVGHGTLAAGLQSDGSLGAAGTLTVTAGGSLAAQGRALAAGDLTFTGQSIDLSGSQTRAGHDLSLSARQGDVTNAGGHLAANGTVSIATPGRLINGGSTAAQGGTISGSTLDLTAASLANGYGTLTQTGTGDLTLAFAGAVDNADGILASNADNLTLQAASLDDTGGAIQQAGNGALTLDIQGDLTNTGGRIAGNGALDLRSGGTLGNGGGTLSVAGDATLNAVTINDDQGSLIADTIDATATQAFTNTGGTVQAAGALTLDAGSLDNTGGFIKVTEAQALDLTTGGALTNGAGGFIGGNGAVTLRAGSLVNAGQVYAGQALDATVQGALSNDGGALQAMGSLGASSGGALSNRSGQIEAGAGDGSATLGLTAARLDDAGGRIANAGQGASTFTIVQGILNEGGTLGGQGAVTLSAASVDNSQGGHLVAGQDLGFDIGGMNNAGGTVYAAGNFDWNNGHASLANAGGHLGAGGDLSLALQSLANTGGTVAAAGDVTLDAGTLAGAGRMAAGRNLALTSSGSYTNAVGNQLVANGNMTLDLGGDFSNAAGATLQAIGALAVDASAIDNAAGATINSAATTLTTGGALTNEGEIEGDGITLNAGSLTNTATILGGTIVATAGSLANGADLGTTTANNPYQSALIAGSRSIALYVSGTLLNRDATIFTLGDLTLAADAQGDASQAVTNRSGDIEADGNVTLDATQFTNQRRVLQITTVNLTAAQQAQNTTTGTPLARYLSTDTNPDRRPPNVTAAQVIDRAEFAEAKAYCDAHDGSNARCVGYPQGVGAPVIFRSVGTATVTSVTRLEAASAQSRLLASGNITLNGSVLNDTSTIAAGNNLMINGQNGSQGGGNTSTATVQNVAWAPTAQVTERVQDQTAWQYLQNDPRTWIDGGWWTYGTTTGQQQMSLAPGAAPSWVTYNAGAGLAANMTAGSTVAITAQTISNTTVGADGQPVHAVIGLGSNGGAQTVGGSAAAPVTSARGTSGRAGSVALGSAPGQVSATTAALPQSTAPVAASAPSAGHASTTATASPQVVSTLVGPNASVRLPQSGLYTVNSSPTASFLIETNPQFTQYGNFISSDYLLQQLGYDPATTEERLGDGFYEEQQVLDQITGLTGRRFLADDTDALGQYRQLMSNAAGVAKQFDLSVGVALTPAQMADLTQDIVWLVSVTVDGQQVLEPVVYLSAQDAKKLTASGATIAGRNVILDASGDITNNGTIAAGHDAQLAASNLLNSGTISAGNALSIDAAQDILNGGTLSAGGNVSLVAGNDALSGVNVAQSLGAVSLAGLGSPLGTVALTNLALSGSLRAGGDLSIRAGRDLTLDTAPVEADGNLSLAAGRDLTAAATAITAGGDAQLLAGRDLSLLATASTNRIGEAHNSVETTTRTVSTLTAGGALTLMAGTDLTSRGAQLTGSTLGLAAGNDVDLNAVADSATRTTQGLQGHTVVTIGQTDQSMRGTTLTSTNDLAVSAGHDLTVTAGNLASTNGNVTLAAGHDLHLDAAQQNDSGYRDTVTSHHGFLSSSKTEAQATTSDSEAIGTTVSGNDVTLAAGHDLTGTAVQIAGTHDVTLAAENDLTLTAGQDTYIESDHTKVSRTGLMNGGGFSALIGNRTTKAGDTVSEVSYTGSLVGSTNGAVTLNAGHDVHLTGSDVLSQTATTIVGQNVTLDAALGSEDITRTQSVHASGIHVGLGGAVVSTVQAVPAVARRGSQTQDSRVEALYAMQAAYATDQAVQSAHMVASGSGGGEGVNLQVGITGSTARSKVTTHDDVTYGSHVGSNGNVAIAATNGDLNIVGSQIDGNNVALSASHDLKLLSQAEQHAEQNTSSDASGGVGVSFGTNGLNVYVQAAMGRGEGHGNGTTRTDTVVNAADTLTLVSGNDTTIRGAQAKGNTVLATIGGNLDIASEQDTDDYANKQWQTGGEVMIGMGGGGSFSYSQHNENNHAASVTQTSGIGAGSGGFDIDVGGNTHLKGAVIASTADPSRNVLSTQSLTYENIENTAGYHASGYGAALTYAAAAKGEQKINMAGTGPQVPVSADRSGTTQSAIARGTLDIRDGAGTDISRDPSWNAGQVDAYSQQQIDDKQALANAFVGTAGMTASAIYGAREADYDAKIQQKLDQARDAESEGNAAEGQALRWDAFNLQQQRDNPKLSPVEVGAATALAGSLLGGSPNLGYLAQSSTLDGIGNAWTNAGKGFNQTQAVKVTCTRMESACQNGVGGFQLDTGAPLSDQLTQLKQAGYTVTLLDAIPAEAVGTGGKTYVTTNGILNTLPRAAQVMTGFVADSTGQKNTTFYLQYNQTYGLVSDLFQAGWDKFVAPVYGQYSATTNALAAAIEQYPGSASLGNVSLYGHSWGTITTRNTENILVGDGYKNPGMSVAVFGPAVRPGAIVDPLVLITGNQVGGKGGLAKSGQIAYYSKYDDPVASFVGGTIFYSPYFDPKSGVYLPGASQGNVWQALKGLGPVFGGSINPHSCYNLDCLGTSQNWTVQDALNYSLKHESSSSQSQPSIQMPPPVSIEASSTKEVNP